MHVLGLSLPLLYLILGFLVVLILPLLIIYHVDQVNTVNDFVAPQIRHTKESVLILHTSSGTIHKSNYLNFHGNSALAIVHLVILLVL